MNEKILIKIYHNDKYTKPIEMFVDRINILKSIDVNVNNVKFVATKYRVWDYVVYKDSDEIKYIKISSITIDWMSNISYNWIYEEEKLRSPTEEEMDMFFR